MKSKVRILLIGPNGQMGRAVSTAVESELDFVIAARCERGDALEEEMTNVDVAIDFTRPEATKLICTAATKKKLPLVIGTTGHSSEQREKIEEAGKTIPVVYSPNFSVGVNTLFWLVRKTAELLGDDFDLEIVEMHHRLKKDAPSGTAKKLTEILMETRKIDKVRHGRDGNMGERLDTEIGIHAVVPGLDGADAAADAGEIFGDAGHVADGVEKNFAGGSAAIPAGIVFGIAGVLSIRN